MAAPTTAEMLENVANAINARVLGQEVEEYSVNGRSIKRCTLGELRMLERTLLQRQATEGGRTTRAVAFRQG